MENFISTSISANQERINYANHMKMTIPKELQQIPTWVLFKLEWDEEKKKFKKIPHGGNGYPLGIKNSNIEKYLSFETALSIYINHVKGFDGIGFAFTNQNDIMGIDIDKCVQNGVLNEDAKEIIFDLKSYCEYSPSATGIHIILKGSMNEGWRNKVVDKTSQVEYEMYDQERFFTFTANSIMPNYTEVVQSDALESIYQKFWASNIEKPTQQSFPNNVTFLSTSSEENRQFLELGIKKDPNLSALLNGEIRSGDESSDDFKIMCKLAHWTNKDADLMREVFTQSNYYNQKDQAHLEKWENRNGDRYALTTIQRAIECTTETAKERQLAFQAKQQTRNEFSPPQRPEKPYLVRSQNAKGTSVDVPLLTDYMLNSFDLKYFGGTFRLFEDGYYKPVSLQQLTYKELPRIHKDHKIAERVESNLRLEDTISLSQNDLASDRYINFKNGVYDIETRELLPHSKDLLFVNQVPYNYNPEAPKCEILEAFFKNAVEDDYELRKLLIQIAGVMISDIRTFKRIFYFNGEKDTGKSTFCAILQKLLTSPTGEIGYSSLSLAQLMNEESYELHKIFGKKANIETDVPVSKPIKNDAVLKKLSGGVNERITAQIKHAEAVEGTSRAMMIMAGNGLPKLWIQGDKSALTDRLMPITFKNAVPLEKQINDLENKINYEYLIKLAIEELHEFINNNRRFIEPQSVKDERERMKTSNDIIYEFKKEMLEYAPGCKIAIKEMRYVFLYWATAWEGENVNFTQRSFTEKMKRELGENNFQKNGTHYYGQRTNAFLNYKINDELYKAFKTKNKGEITHDNNMNV